MASLVNYKDNFNYENSDSNGDYVGSLKLKKRDIIAVDLLPYIGMRINNIDINFLFGLGYRKYGIEMDREDIYNTGTLSGVSFKSTKTRHLKTPCFKTGIEVKYRPIKFMTVNFNCGYLIAGSRTLSLPSTTESNSNNSTTYTIKWTNDGTILKTIFQVIDFGIGIGFHL